MARCTLIVGTRNWSSWSLRPFLALAATGAPFETVDIRLRQTRAPSTREQILKYSPAGKVPVMEGLGVVVRMLNSLPALNCSAQCATKYRLKQKD